MKHDLISAFGRGLTTLLLAAGLSCSSGGNGTSRTDVHAAQDSGHRPQWLSGDCRLHRHRLERPGDALPESFL
jgi:hypothetical protein